MVAVIHSIPNRSEWLCAKFPGLCHSNVSCVLGSHSTLLKKDDLLSQRSHTVCTQWVLFGLHQIKNFELVPNTKKKLEDINICISGFLEKLEDLTMLVFLQQPSFHESCILHTTRDPTSLLASLCALSRPMYIWVWDPWPRFVSYVTWHREQGLQTIVCESNLALHMFL